MIINRVWSMPNSKTFKIPAIRALILRYVKMYHDTHITSADIERVIDPFANEASIKKYMRDFCLMYISNDIDPQYNTDYHKDALEFLKDFDNNSVGIVFYDPPYSFRQVSECYKKLDLTVTAKDTSNAFFANFKKEIARVVEKDGIVISCGWNSNGIGKKLGFEQQEILLVAHGSNHNDTIVTVERKVE